jgi:hypothetical protein
MIDRMSRIAGADKRMRALVDPLGAILADGFHLMGLFAIGAATVWAAVATFWSVVEKGSPTIDDLLLLFIYLEIGSMVGIYFRTNHLPVRFLLYVGITADETHDRLRSGSAGSGSRNSDPDSLHPDPWVAVLVIRFTSNRFPSPVYGEAGRSGVKID